MTDPPTPLHPECVACSAQAFGFDGAQGAMLPVIMMLHNGFSAAQLARWMCFLHRRMLMELLEDWQNIDTPGKEPA